MKLKTMKANMIELLFKDWITDINTQNAFVECFINNNPVNAITFNIFIDEYGKVDTATFYVNKYQW